MEHGTTVQILPLSRVPLLELKSHTYLRHCSCRCCIILLLFYNEKPTSSSSQPLLLHLLANKGLHYLQLHGSHQLQNCRYCNTQNILKRDKRNNYMCKTPQLNFCRKQRAKRHGLPQVLPIIIRGDIIYMNLITLLLKTLEKLFVFPMRLFTILKMCFFHLLISIRPWPEDGSICPFSPAEKWHHFYSPQSKSRRMP